MALPPFNPDETKPVASDNIALFPAVEQTFRDIIESWILIEHNRNGTHTQVTLDDIATPTIAATLVGLWQESGVLKTRYAAGAVTDLATTGNTVAKTGDTMTGLLVLSGNPSAALGAAPKQYVDLRALLSGATFTGDVNTSGALNVSDAVTIPAAVITSAASIALSMTGKNKKTLTLDHDTTITVSGEVADQVVELWITQGSTGGTVAWSGVDKWIGGAVPPISTTTGQIDIVILSAASDGTTIIGQHAGTAS